MSYFSHFYENFSDNIHLWTRRNDACAKIYTDYAKTTYILEHIDNPKPCIGYSGFIFDFSKNYQIITYMTKVMGNKSDYHGVVWGFKNRSNFYRFLISDNEWYLGTQYNGSSIIHIDWTNSPHIGKHNRLDVIKVANYLSVKINGNIVIDHFPFANQINGNHIGFEVFHSKMKIYSISFDYIRQSPANKPNYRGNSWDDSTYEDLDTLGAELMQEADEDGMNTYWDLADPNMEGDNIFKDHDA